MTPKEPAERQLERILHILPAAVREGGASLAGLATELGVSRGRILRDLAEVTARALYLPPGEFPDIDVTIEGDRVAVWTTGEFRRPARLSPWESLALALGLRLLAGEVDADRRARLRALSARLDAALASMPDHPARAAFDLDVGDPSGGGILALLKDAVRARRRCRLAYLKPGATRPEDRLLAPYTVVFAGGRWYALGESAEVAAVRAFRLDRILEAEPLDAEAGAYEVPDSFDPEDWLEEGILFRADSVLEAEVRYSPRIARWILERRGEDDGRLEIRPDGSVVVRHSVGDPAWFVRHVLAHGPDAQALAPTELRDLVVRRIRALAT